MRRTLSKKLADVKPGTMYVGVDMGLEHNVAVVLGERAERRARFQFPNDQDGYAYFHGRVAALQEQHEAAGVLVGMEATNYYWKLLVADLERRGMDYRLVNSYTVKKHREGDQLDRSKDDARDAFTIADLLRTGKFTETRMLHGQYAELRQYVGLYDRLRRNMQRQKNLIHNITGQLFPELGRVFKDFTGQTALALLRRHAAAVVVREMSLEAFIASVRGNLVGRRLMVTKLRRVHELAAVSIGLQEGIQALQLALRQHIQTLEVLRWQHERTQAALLETFAALPESRYLLSMHGLGAVSAAFILGEIGDPRNYRNAGQWVKLAGIQPVPNLSGQKKNSRTPMSHKGRSRLRTTLYFAVLRLIQFDDAFARQYQRFQQRKKNPLSKMEALGALMNRLLRILWALVRHQRLYDPDYQWAA